MKKLFVFLCAMFVCVIAFAQTINVTWKVGNTTYASNTCEYGGTLTVPSTPPTKYGYTFRGWEAIVYLEYIESSGTQYIDTGIIPNATTRAVGRIAFPTPSTTNLAFGSRTTGTYDTSPDQLYFGCQNGVLFYYSGFVRTIVQSSAQANIFYNIDITNSSATQTATQNIYLFGLNFIGTFAPDSSSRIAYLKFYNNGQIVRDFIPAKRISDNAIGMYDTVTKTFFENAGTGTFIAGPELGAL